MEYLFHCCVGNVSCCGLYAPSPWKFDVDQLDVTIAREESVGVCVLNREFTE